MSFVRPTSLAAAFVRASASLITAGKVDHSQATWIPRRVVHNATERGEMFGMVREFDKRPAPVQKNAGIRVLNEPSTYAAQIAAQEDDGFCD